MLHFSTSAFLFENLCVKKSVGSSEVSPVLTQRSQRSAQRRLSLVQPSWGFRKWQN